MTAQDRLLVYLLAIAECPAEYMDVDGQQLRVYRSPDGNRRFILCGRLEKMLAEALKEADE